MKDLSQNLFIGFVLSCFVFFYYFYLVELNDISYNVLDKHNFEVQATFDNKWKADKYIQDYKESHDYILQEVHNKNKWEFRLDDQSGNGLVL